MERIYLQAENFRDKAWGVYRIDACTELVLEMTSGYSDLYFRNSRDHELTKELFFEEPDHKRINDYCRTMWNVEFV